MRRRLRGASQKGQSRSLRQSQENSPGDCKASEPSPCCAAGKQRAHSAGCGEEWWGWILGGDTTWGSRGPPRALQPPSAASKSCKPHAACAPPEPARRKSRSEGDTEGHGDTEPAQRANARLEFPRESNRDRHTQCSVRSAVFRKPSLSKIVISIFLLLSSPGRRLGSDATAHTNVLTGYRHSTSLAPGDLRPDDHLPDVPIHGCSEHARCSMHWSTDARDTRASLRGHQERQKGRQERLSEVKAPGARALCPSPYMTLIHMSDVHLLVTTQDSPRD